MGGAQSQRSGWSSARHGPQNASSEDDGVEPSQIPKRDCDRGGDANHQGGHEPTREQKQVEHLST